MGNKHNLALLQVLRGLAALLVLFHHGAGIGSSYLKSKYFDNIFSAGWIGVDIFFVLSGFIMFYVHHKDFGHWQNAKRFYLKRFIRIYPIYWVITLFLIVIFFMVPSWGIGYETKLDVIVKSLFLFPQKKFTSTNCRMDDGI